MSAFDIATAVTPVGPEQYEAAADPGWFVNRGGNGGYVAAVMLRALTAAVDDASRVPRSLTVHYPAAFQEGRGDIHARVERSGRSLTTAAARMTQGSPDRPVALAVGAFAAARQPAVSFSDTTMPDVPGFDEIEPVPLPPFVPPFVHNLNARRAAGDPPFAGSDKAYAAVWIALKDEQPLDYPRLAMLTEAWMPVLFSTQTAPAMSPTIDLTVHFRSPLPVDDAGPFLCVFRTRLAADGYMEEDGEVWSRDGVLLAQSRQLALAVPAEGM